jgi:hypothetical protein
VLSGLTLAVNVGGFAFLATGLPAPTRQELAAGASFSWAGRHDVPRTTAQADLVSALPPLLDAVQAYSDLFGHFLQQYPWLNRKIPGTRIGVKMFGASSKRRTLKYSAPSNSCVKCEHM